MRFVRRIALLALALLPITTALAQDIGSSSDLALHKNFISSDPNVSGWNAGLTDGIWNADQGQIFATGASAQFPKTVTIDLKVPSAIGYVALGVPPFGSTKTVAASVSTDGMKFTSVGRYVFSLNKAENHLFAIAPVTARYVRLTYVNQYSDTVNFPSFYAFTTELAVYAPGAVPVLPAAQAGPEPADVAAPKRDGSGAINPDFLASHASFLQRDKAGPIGVLFLGDSITHRWSGPNVKNIWEQHFGQYNPANFGIEGDRTQHVLWRIENGELDGIHPKVVVLMLGTNNIGYASEDVIKGDKAVVEAIRRHLPDTKVLLLGIFPRGADAADPVRAKIKFVNAELAKLDNGSSIFYLDIGDKFLDTSGNLTKEMMPDALHPAPQGYQIWADAMQPLLDKMMK